MPRLYSYLLVLVLRQAEAALPERLGVYFLRLLNSEFTVLAKKISRLRSSIWLPRIALKVPKIIDYNEVFVKAPVPWNDTVAVTASFWSTEISCPVMITSPDSLIPVVSPDGYNSTDAGEAPIPANNAD